MIEITRLRGPSSKQFQVDAATRRFEQIPRTRIHYQDAGGAWQEVDMRAQRVTDAQLDGWRVTQNGWHYALGQPADKPDDGWLGFGGRQGRHWLLMRLARVGYLHLPSDAWTGLGGSAAYDRAHLSSQAQEYQMGDRTLYLQSSATWAELWQVNGDTIDVTWRLEGTRLKEEIRLGAGVREYLQDSLPPATFDETYFGFVYELDASDIPQWAVRDLLVSLDDSYKDFSDEGEDEMRLQDETGELLAFLPVDFAYLHTVAVASQKIRLTKRVYKRDGVNYLFVGCPVSALWGLPEGDVIFDPTFETQDGTLTEDTRNDSDNTSTTYGSAPELYMLEGSYSRYGFLRFDCADIDSGSTCLSATLELTVGLQDAASTLNVHSMSSATGDWSEADLNWNVYKSGTPWPGSPGGSTAGTDYESGTIGSASVGTTGSTLSISLDTDRIAGWFGPNNTNYGLRISVPSAYMSWYASEDSTLSNRPKLTIEYEYPVTDPATAEAGTANPGVILGSLTLTPTAANARAAAQLTSIIQGSRPPVPLIWQGDAYVESQQAAVSVMILATNGSDWTFTDAGAAVALGAEIARTRGYLTLQ